MRRLLTVGCLLVVATTTQAQTLYVTEPFTGLTSGQPLSGQGSGIGWNSSSWGVLGGGATVQTGSLSFGSLLTSGDSVTTSITTQNTRTASSSAAPSGTTDYWASFLINTTATASGQYAGFSIGSVFIGKSSGTGGNWGMDNVGGSNSADSGVAVGSGTTTLLVAHLTSTGTSLYVNPTPGGAPPITPNVTSSALTSVDLNGALVQLFNGGGSTPISAFDEFRVGDSFIAVTPVPEPVTTGLLAAAGLGLTGAVRRRRR